MQLGWVTDPHLDHADEQAIEALLTSLERSTADAVLVGGDIGEARSAMGFLERIGARARRPVYFVLGNHDYYGGAIGQVREAARALTARDPWCRWLPAQGVVSLDDQTALVGHGGWSDGRCGDFMASSVMLNDYLRIKDLVTPDKAERLARLMAQGDEAAEALRPLLEAALATHRRVVALTHVPPFLESCWHEGKISEGAWTPHFTCVAMGEMLLEVMAAHPDRHLEVLCGHTHSPGVARMRPNLVVHTAGAVYGRPRLDRVLDTDAR